MHRGGCVKEVVKGSELEKREIRDAYRLLIELEWLSVKDARWLSVKDEWEKFKSFILRSAGDICEYRKIGMRGKKSKWWDDEMRELVEDSSSSSSSFICSSDVYKWYFTLQLPKYQYFYGSIYSTI